MNELTGHDKEYQGGELLEHGVEPLILKGNRDPEQVDDDPREVDVADHHDVEVTEQLQLLQAHGRLAVSSRGVLSYIDINTNNLFQ